MHDDGTPNNTSPAGKRRRTSRQRRPGKTITPLQKTEGQGLETIFWIGYRFADIATLCFGTIIPNAEKNKETVE